MTLSHRRVLAALVLGATLVAAATVACSSNSGAPTVVGTPCTPYEETLSSFRGHNEQEITIGNDAGSGGPFCLVYDFRGRVACPYGQDERGQAPPGAEPCKTPAGSAVIGTIDAGQSNATVKPQCVDRRAADAVIWSCRCANDFGKSDDGDTYCACPSSTTCTSLINGSGPSMDHMAGSYCIKTGTATSRGSVCSASCDPATHPCP